MHHATLILHVRQIVHNSFREQGAPEDMEIQVTILVRDSYYCGRRFLCGNLSAIWYCEDNQIKFHGEDGSVVEVVDATAPSHLNVA